MSTGKKLLIGAGGFVLAWWLLPTWLIVAIVVGVPVAAYFMLDESQRRRLTGRSRRRSIDY
ncbi:hypothetical protein [Phytoactinopolyspora halotolerans]|uniref:Uncharacterized protein n=1 Tax=Phytoactinopolyspora halotolerans TaxID=1981512 RepID=A0A6L9SCD1_9ACTN|nr:hypothetical protein [Phytoactinopolyspora halotolerans]NEE03035.1 hypothetical protein [Phytoactinopolyspora halotolerans]